MFFLASIFAYLNLCLNKEQVVCVTPIVIENHVSNYHSLSRYYLQRELQLIKIPVYRIAVPRMSKLSNFWIHTLYLLITFLLSHLFNARSNHNTNSALFLFYVYDISFFFLFFQLLSKAARDMASTEHQLETSEENLKKMQLIAVHMGYQFENIQKSAQLLTEIGEKVSAMSAPQATQRW